MNKGELFADLYVNLHLNRLTEYRTKVEKALYDLCGVYSVQFDVDECCNTMVVKYNPEAVSSEVVLDTIRSTHAGTAGMAYMLMTMQDE